MRTPIKTKCGDKQWKPCHLLLARAFIFHIIKCFHQWSSAHSFNPVNHNPDHIALGEEKKKNNNNHASPVSLKERNVCFPLLFSLWSLQTDLGSSVMPYDGRFAPAGQATRTFKEVSLQLHNIILFPFPFLASFPKQVSMSKENSWVGGLFDLGHTKVKLFTSC